MMLPWVQCKRSQWQLQSEQMELVEMKNRQKSLVRELEEATDRIRTLRVESETTTRENEQLFKELRERGESMNLEDEDYLRLETIEEAYVERLDLLQKHIQESSQKRVVERWGSGPHRVEATLKGEDGTRSKLVIELALLLEMPHAVLHFLKMVDLKLWDGLALIHGLPDSNQIVTSLMAVDTHHWAGQRFIDANLTRLAFPEFSSTYPPPSHHKYSISFVGRPGGPDFLISLEDEMPHHEHESTFGLVVEGREALDRFYLQRSETKKVPALKIESLRLMEDSKVSKTSSRN
jgi:hypothetical protein